MAVETSPNMSLPIPAVGEQPGPLYAENINSCLTLLDSHDHSPGKGVQITPDGLNINAALTLNTNFITDVAGVVLAAQGSTPTTDGTIYESGVDLFYVDGSGNNIRITQNGAVAGTPGSIANLTSPASASYVSGQSTFVWQSDTNIAANMDFGAAIMRNLSPNSTYALTLQPPASLSSNYSITLPALPAGTAFVTIANTGAMATTISTTQGITASMIANQTITSAQIANNTITLTQLANSVLNWTKTSISSNGSFTVGASANALVVTGWGAGQGGGSGGVSVGTLSTGARAGSGGAGAVPETMIITTVPGESLDIEVGVAGTGGAAVASTGSASGNAGTAGGDTLILRAGPAFTGNRTSGSATISSIASTTGLVANMRIVGTGFPANTFIKSVDSSTQITASAVATSGSATSTSFASATVLARFQGASASGAAGSASNTSGTAGVDAYGAAGSSSGGGAGGGGNSQNNTPLAGANGAKSHYAFGGLGAVAAASSSVSASAGSGGGGGASKGKGGNGGLGGTRANGTAGSDGTEGSGGGGGGGSTDASGTLTSGKGGDGGGGGVDIFELGTP